MSNPELISRFVSFLRSERGLSANTLAAYECDITKFAEWAEKPLAKVERLDIQKYLGRSTTEENSGHTKARRLASMRAFYQFLIDEEEVTSDPTRNVPTPKQSKSLPKALGLPDLEKMVASLGDAWIDIRDRAMLLTFFASGLRESELANLELKDLDLSSGVVKVWAGKGNKDGVAPLNPPAVEALEVYLNTVRPQLEGTDHSTVFLGLNGHKLTRQAIWIRVSGIAEAALERHVSPHYLRHGFATALIQGGADVRDVQALMRHSSVDTTAIYIHTDLTYLRRIYYESHPRARIVSAKG